MHRPNRIGNHQLVDPSVTYVDLNITSVANVDRAQPDFAVQTDSAVVTDQHSVMYHKPDANTWTIPGDHTLAFGRFVPGFDPSHESPHLINVKASFMFWGATALGSNFVAGMYAGLLTSGSPSVDYTSVVNNVTGGVSLCHSSLVRAASGIEFCVDETLCVGDFSVGGSFDTQPVAIFFGLTNFAAGSFDVTNMQASLSVYRWAKDQVILDPTKS